MACRTLVSLLFVAIQHTEGRINALAGSSLEADRKSGQPVAALLNAGDQNLRHPVATLLRTLHLRGWASAETDLLEGYAKASAFTWVLWILVIVVVIIGITAAFWYHHAKNFEAAVKKGIKDFGHLDVDIDTLHFSPFSGYLKIQGFTIFNPEPFKSDYFLKAKTITLDLRMGKLITSLGKIKEVDNLTFKDVEVIVEYAGYFSGATNVNAIMDKVKGADTKSKEVAAKPQEPAKPEDSDPKKQAPVDSGGKRTILHKVVLEDVGMKIATKLLGAHVSAGDMKYEDFEKEVGHSMVDDIALEILKTLVKTVLEHMAGANFAKRFL